MTHARSVGGTAAALLLVSGMLLSPGTGEAAVADVTLVVNTDSDTQAADGACSLREAVRAADAALSPANDDCGTDDFSGADTITFDTAAMAGTTITLGSRLPNITSDIAIVGSGAITLDGDNASRAFIVAADGTLDLDGVNIVNGFQATQSGAAIWVRENGTLIINGSTLSGNSTADGDGGAILVDDGGTLTVTDSTFADNSAPTIRGGGNRGGALYVAGEATISGSTFTGNTASFGGAIAVRGTATVTNSTFVGNEAHYGGALFLEWVSEPSSGVVTNSTFIGNDVAEGWGQGSGIYVGDYGTVTVSNTVIGGSSEGDNCEATYPPDVHQFQGPAGSNISDDGSCSGSGFQPGLITEVADLGLSAALADNGGPTQTMLPQTGSPLLDAGDAAACPATDQRGSPRPQGAGCDIGAVELFLGTAPVAADDAYTTAEVTTLVVDAADGVLDNDSDVDGDTLTADLVSSTTQGTLDLQPDGSFTYTPDAGFTGTDSFTYTADDGTASSALATVTITVTPGQTGPPPTGNPPGGGLADTGAPVGNLLPLGGLAVLLGLGLVLLTLLGRTRPTDTPHHSS